MQINQPDVDPSNGLVPLTIDFVDVARLVDENGCAQTAKSSFTYTGRGGLPPNPKEVLTPDAVQVDWVTLNPEIEPSSKRNISPNSTSLAPTLIVEATGWAFGPKGEVILTAQALPEQHQNSWQPSPQCHES